MREVVEPYLVNNGYYPESSDFQKMAAELHQCANYGELLLKMPGAINDTLTRVRDIDLV